jgi:hypothetical protein
VKDTLSILLTIASLGPVLTPSHQVLIVANKNKIGAASFDRVECAPFVEPTAREALARIHASVGIVVVGQQLLVVGRGHLARIILGALESEKKES